MRNRWLIPSLGLIIVLVLGYMGINFIREISSTVKHMEDDNQLYQSHLGDTVILGEDTLLVVDYSIINGIYTLSNGVVVNSLIINK